MARYLSAILIEFRRYLARKQGVAAFLRGTTACAACFLAAAVIDNLFGWNALLRWLVWGGMAAALLYFPVAACRFRRRLAKRSDRAIALELERRLGIRDNALVNGVEFRSRDELPAAIRQVYERRAEEAAMDRSLSASGGFRKSGAGGRRCRAYCC